MSTDTTIVRTTVAEGDDRMNFLPDRFGLMTGLFFENSVFDLAGKLSPDYGGGHWEFYTLDNRGWYLAPVNDTDYRVVVEGNGYEGTLSPDAFGIVVTLFAMNAALWNAHLPEKKSRYLSNAYDALKDYAEQHAEAAAIYRAID